MPSRRAFLRASLRGSSLLALAPTVPGFLAQTAHAATPDPDGRVLVVVQLDGGNDGINTVVPFDDDGYARHRQALRLPTDRLIKIGDGIGLHPSMTGAAELLESGRLAIVPGVGYPNPSRSHFQSMAIWHSARLDPAEHDGQGWLGRAFDAAEGTPSSLHVGSGPPPVALRGRRSTASALERIDEYAIDLILMPGRSLVETGADAVGDDLAAFVRRSTLEAYATADQLAELARSPDEARYPATGLADRLRTIARLLKAGHAARAYYTIQPGYDTHAGQLPTHARLLAELSGGLKAFLDDLAESGLADRVLVICFSEFGRRVGENGSAGTDHGTAGPVLLAGPGVRAGLVGPCPSLEDLEDGDLRTAIDFRQVYATMLQSWLGLPVVEAVVGPFEPLPLLGG